MDALVCARERALGKLTLVLGLLAWVLLVVGTFGVALAFLALAFVVYVFTHSMLIAHIRGHGVRVSPQQFPDLHAQFEACYDKLQIARRPKAYVLNGGGWMNAFATRFLGTEYVVLLSEVVDAMDGHPDGVRFYIGHELGHLRLKHLTGMLWRWPVLWLPLLGGAYARSRETSCDLHGAACCSTPDNAARALLALSTGPRRWKIADPKVYGAQASNSTGFWMSFHELTAGYAWTTKRVLRTLDPGARIPSRHPVSYALAAFVPYAGRLGGAFGALILVYILGVLAAIAIPAYSGYQTRAALAGAWSGAAQARDALGEYYRINGAVPASLQDAGLPEHLADGSTLQLDSDKMVLTVTTAKGSLVFTPRLDENDKLVWSCGSDDLKPDLLPRDCN